MALRSPTILRRALLTACLGALSWASPALALEASELIEQIEGKYAKVDSLKADFTQTSKSELFGDEVTKGELLVARPAKMRWTYGTEKLFVTNGEKMWIYTEEDRQVIEYDDVSSARSSADALFTSLDKLHEVFDVKVLSSTEAGHRVELRPHEEAQFKVVQLMLDAELLVKKVVITDTFDAVTELDFDNVKLNLTVADAEFVFTVPDGVDVVKANTN